MLNVVMYSYVDRAIFNIIFTGTGLGIANKYGGTGIIAGVRIPYGVQTMEWTLDAPEGMAPNGERVKLKNKINDFSGAGAARDAVYRLKSLSGRYCRGYVRRVYPRAHRPWRKNFVGPAIAWKLI